MPLYEYLCPACGCKSEFLQKLGADGKRLECPHCQHQGLERCLSCCVVKGAGETACGTPACGSGFS